MEGLDAINPNGIIDYLFSISPATLILGIMWIATAWLTKFIFKAWREDQKKFIEVNEESIKTITLVQERIPDIKGLKEELKLEIDRVNNSVSLVKSDTTNILTWMPQNQCKAK